MTTAPKTIRSGDLENADYGTFRPRPIIVSEEEGRNGSLMFVSPFISPLVFENVASDARDHCANERNFLSYLRLSMYLVIISVAITLSFHFKTAPTEMEKKMALPLGMIFWTLSLLTLVTGLANYCGTIEKYRRQKALVQSGIITNIVFGVVALTIIGTCIIFLKSGAPSGKSGSKKRHVRAIRSLISLARNRLFR